jgi:hypothetical protein
MAIGADELEVPCPAKGHGRIIEIRNRGEGGAEGDGLARGGLRVPIYHRIAARAGADIEKAGQWQGEKEQHCREEATKKRPPLGQEIPFLALALTHRQVER